MLEIKPMALYLSMPPSGQYVNRLSREGRGTAIEETAAIPLTVSGCPATMPGYDRAKPVSASRPGCRDAACWLASAVRGSVAVNHT